MITDEDHSNKKWMTTLVRTDSRVFKHRVDGAGVNAPHPLRLCLAQAFLQLQPRGGVDRPKDRGGGSGTEVSGTKGGEGGEEQDACLSQGLDPLVALPRDQQHLG